MKKISILTSTRAEYGLLKPLIIELNKKKNIEVYLVVTGMHLSPEFGNTYKEIEQDGIEIHEKIDILLSSDGSQAISKTMGLTMISFADYFNRLEPDCLIVLGDRYEVLAVASVATNARIPIVHIHGGETTEGAVDESIRHALTKFSYLHFTSTEVYRKRVIQLGEHPNRVFNVGALGVENIHREKLLSRIELEEDLNLKFEKPFALVTFHPVTLEADSSKNQITELLNACRDTSDMNFIFTKSNADTDGRIINRCIDEYAQNYSNIITFTSLGMKRYLSLMKLSSMVLGNSSSGIIESPTFRIPTINIGDRQKGRIQAENVINCIPRYDDIIASILIARSDNFLKKINDIVNPYGKGETSIKIANTIDAFLSHQSINLKKTFFDME